MAKWRFIGSCADFKGLPFDTDTIKIEGLNLWAYPWIALREPQILVPDLNDILRKHHAKLYEINHGRGILKFACYYSNGIWHFYASASSQSPENFEANIVKYEGYWRLSQDEASNLPWPVPVKSWNFKDDFLKLLDKVEKEAERIAYRGFSICRLCGCRNGNEGLRLEDWEWPAGYRHYIANHEVRPSPDFESFIVEVNNVLNK